MIFCYGEGQEFPETEFAHDAQGHLRLPPLHQVQPLHYSNGHLQSQPGAPEAAFVHGFFSRETIERLARTLDATAPADDQAQAIEELLDRVRSFSATQIRELVTQADAMLGREPSADVDAAGVARRGDQDRKER